MDWTAIDQLKLYVPVSCDFGSAETAEEDPHTKPTHSTELYSN